MQHGPAGPRCGGAPPLPAGDDGLHVRIGPAQCRVADWHRRTGGERVLGHDAEVPAPSSSAAGPEQIRVLRGAGADGTAVGEHDLDSSESIAREAVLAVLEADAASEGEAGDPTVAQVPVGTVRAYGSRAAWTEYKLAPAPTTTVWLLLL